MSQINYHKINEELLDQLERIGNKKVIVDTIALKIELDRSRKLSLKAELAQLIPQNMMLLQQIRDEAPMFLIRHPDVEKCFQAQCECLESLVHLLEQTDTLPAA